MNVLADKQKELFEHNLCDKEKAIKEKEFLDIYSDRGSQYTSEAFREALSNARVQQSLSGVDHCYDNSISTL